MQISESLSFDDVLLAPKYSEIESRSQVDTSVDLGKGIILKCPIVSANMSDVTGPEMARAIGSIGGLAILHRFYSVDEQLNDYLNLIKDRCLSSHVALSVGVREEDKTTVDKFLDNGCKIICIDVAHGHHKNCGKMTEYASKKGALVIAGNVATAEGAEYLYNMGADVIKSGVGSGSICLTRVETGNGVPQFTVISNIAQHRESKGLKFKLISDGGIRKAGDLVKSLCFSDACMIGNMLAGTNEAPGEIVNIEGVAYKQYRGSSTHKEKNIEGVKGLVPLKGPVLKIIEKLMDGLRSGCSYQGASNLRELKNNPQFVKITNSGLIESGAHDVIVK